MDFYVAKAVANLPASARPGRPGQSQAPRSRARQSPLRADPRRPRPAPAARPSKPANAVSALRFGDPRVMALFQAITGFTHLPRGFRNRDLRPQVEALLGRPYIRRADDLRPAAPAPQRADPSHPEDASLYRDQLRPQGRVLLQQALSPHPPAPVERPAPRRPTTCPGRCAPPSTNSTPKSRNFTRRPLLLPEKLASTVTMSPLEDV